MPTDRADRPEWLFATAARLAGDLGPALVPLQPAIAAAQLSGAYAIQVTVTPLPADRRDGSAQKGMIIGRRLCMTTGDARPLEARVLWIRGFSTQHRGLHLL